MKLVPANRQSLMYSTTMPSAIRELAREWLEGSVHVQAVSEVHVHRIGLTERPSGAGTAVSFCASDESRRLRAIKELTGERIRIESTPGEFQSSETSPVQRITTSVASRSR